MLDSRPSCANQDFTSLPDSRLYYCDSKIIVSSRSSDLSYASRHHALSAHQFVSWHQCVCSFDQYNFLGARLPVPSSLNIPLWRSRLQDYPDYDFLEFGWPAGRLGWIIPVHFRWIKFLAITGRHRFSFGRGFLSLSGTWPWCSHWTLCSQSFFMSYC